MKQKIVNDPPVTKSILNEELKKALSNYATKDDLKKQLSNYPTKEEFKKELKKELSNYPTIIQVEMMFEKSERRTDEKARLYRDEVLTKMDQIVSELSQLREDRLFEKHEKVDLQEQLDDHEKRIKKIEKHSN